MTIQIKTGIALLLGLFSLFAISAADADAPREADKTFQLSVDRSSADELTLHWTIAPDSYLYRDSLHAKLNGRDLVLILPKGEAKDDPNFGAVEVYHGSVEARLLSLPASGQMEVVSRGCAEQGICYPPQAKTIDLQTLAIQDVKPGPGGTRIEAQRIPTLISAAVETGAEEDLSALLGGGLVPILIAFLGFGLLLSFTPCVFPMIPILSAMLAGAGSKLSAGRGFTLSLAYALAMATAYAVVGFVAGMTGANLQVALQTPWALGLTAALFVALSLSMFGFFDLALPAGLAMRLSGRGGRGSLVGAALLGFGSALIVGPCVTPPLAAAMLFAVQTGEAGKGAAALFALGLGMSLPLVAAGTFGAGILPKAGSWLDRVKPIFGAVFLAIAIMLVARLMPEPATLALWGTFAIGIAVFVGAFDRLESSSGWTLRLGKVAGVATAVYGCVLIIGATAGARDPLRPLSFLAVPVSEMQTHLSESRVSSLAGFREALTAAEASGRPVLVSFTADWCTVCKSNEAVMADPAIRSRLKALPIIVADVTTYGEQTRALMTSFAVVGPPTLFLVDSAGHEISGSRLTGPFTPQNLQSRLDQAGV